MGWVKALSKRASALDPTRNALVAHVEWTDVGAKAVAAKHYRYISAGLDMKAKDRLSGKDIGVMLDHVALVKHPFVQGMQPLSLSAAHLQQEKSMDPALLKALGLKEDADTAAALSALGAKNTEIEKLKAESNALKAQNDAGEKRLAALEAAAKSAQLEKLESKLDAKIAAFAIDVAEKPALMELAAASPETFEKLIGLRQSRDPSGPKLNLVKGPSDRLSLQNKAIEERMKLTNETYDVALIACATENPALFTEVA
jgi:phage I-like protein